MKQCKTIVGMCLVAVLCVGMFTGCGGETKTKDKVVPLVKTETVGRSDSDAAHTFAGTIHGRSEAPLAFSLGGKIVARYVQAGDSVEAGTALFRIDDKNASEQVIAARGQLEAAAAQRDLAQSTYGRMAQLYAADAISALQLDQSRNAKELAEAQYRQANASYERALNQESMTTLKSEHAGVVGATLVDVGQVVGAGTPVAVVVDMSEPEVWISLTEQNLHQYRVGESAQVTLWSRPDKTWTATVREIAPAPNRSTGTYDAKLRIDTPFDGEVGMTAKVTFRTDAADVMTIPLTALAQQSETAAVWVVRGEAVRLVPITLGAVRGERVEVRAGLEDGDVVVVAGTQHLYEGAKVRV